MGVAEFRRLALRFHVEQKVDAALGVAADVLGPVGADMGEAHGDEQPGQRLGIGAGEFDEFEAVEAEVVRLGLVLDGHANLPG